MSTGLEFDAAGARRVEKLYLTPDAASPGTAGPPPAARRERPGPPSTRQ